MSNGLLIKSLPIVAAAMGRKHGVTVSIRKDMDTAATNGKQIFLPVLPDTDEALVLARGYIDHESAHIRFTNFKVSLGQGLRKSLVNILEDIRIEQKLSRELPGCKINLEALERALVESGVYKPVTNQSHPAEILVARIHHCLRVSVLQHICTSELADNAMQIWAKTFPESATKAIDEMLMEADSLRDTEHVCDLSDRIMAVIEEDQPDDQDDQQSSDNGESNSDDSQSDQDDSDQQQGDSSDKSEDDQDSSGEEGGDQSESDDQKSDDANGGDDKSGDGDQSSEDNSDENDQSEGSKSGKDKSDDDSDESEGDQSGNTSDDPDGDQDSDESASGDDENSDQSGDKQDPSDKGDEQDKSAEKDGDKGKRKENLQSLRDSKDEEVVEDTDLGDKLKEMLGDLSFASSHSNNSGTFPVQTAKAVGQSIDPFEAARETNALRTRLNGLIQASKLKRSPPRRVGSRVDTRSLHRLSTMDTRVFRGRTEKPAVNTAVVVLLDQSGSMRRTMRDATKAAMAVSLALESIPGVKLSIAGFNSVKNERGDAYTPAISPMKSFNKRTDKDCFVPHCGGGTPVAEALWWSASELLAQHTVERRIVICITDGDPDDFNQTKSIVDKLKGARIETNAIGIDVPISRELFPVNCSINEISELPGKVFSMLEELLIAK